MSFISSKKIPDKRLDLMYAICQQLQRSLEKKQVPLETFLDRAIDFIMDNDNDDTGMMQGECNTITYMDLRNAGMTDELQHLSIDDMADETSPAYKMVMDWCYSVMDLPYFTRFKVQFYADLSEADRTIYKARIQKVSIMMLTILYEVKSRRLYSDCKLLFVSLMTVNYCSYRLWLLITVRIALDELLL